MSGYDHCREWRRDVKISWVRFMALTWRRWSFHEFTSCGQCFCCAWLLIGMLDMLSSLTVESFSIGLESCFALVSLGESFSDASSALLTVL